MSLLGARATVVYQPPTGEGAGAYVAGVWVEAQRVATSQMLTIEPMSKGNYQRLLASEGEWTGGALCIFSETNSLQVSSDIDQSPGSWVEFGGLLYEVDSLQDWYDDLIGHAEYTAHLLRPQPVFTEPDPEEEP